MKLSTEWITHGSKTDITPSNSTQKTELKCRMLFPDPFQIHMSQTYARKARFSTKQVVCDGHQPTLKSLAHSEQDW